MSSKNKQAAAVVAERKRRNSMLMEPKEVTLSGPDRAFIMRAVERVPASARTRQEEELFRKVRA